QNHVRMGIEAHPHAGPALGPRFGPREDGLVAEMEAVEDADGHDGPTAPAFGPAAQPATQCTTQRTTRTAQGNTTCGQARTRPGRSGSASSSPSASGRPASSRSTTERAPPATGAAPGST